MERPAKPLRPPGRFEGYRSLSVLETPATQPPSAPGGSVFRRARSRSDGETILFTGALSDDRWCAGIRDAHLPAIRC